MDAHGESLELLKHKNALVPGDQGKKKPRCCQAIERLLSPCKAQPESLHAW